MSEIDLKFTCKKWLRIDSIGALVSALFLGVVLVHWNEHVDMPIHILYLLASLAILFSAFSMSSYFGLFNNYCKSLQLISIVNLLYCVLTLGLVGLYFNQITLLAKAYFIIEILIVSSLASLELQASKRNKQ